MKITIDTKEDSHEDIKKVMGLLSQVLNGGDPIPNNISENNNLLAPGMMNLFDEPKSTQLLPIEPSQVESAVPELKSKARVEFY